ncbi:MAG TPA: response regulator [Burkholderiales bacterium]|nr:response regulator [Burkholderiales bacterium]
MPAAQACSLPSTRDAGVVLVVDDQSVHRAILEEVLGGLDEPVAVEGIGSAAAALEWARRRVADLVLVDYMMPEMDGIEFVRRLRCVPGYEHVPVVMVTMHDARSVRYAALDAGITDFLSKPVDARECRARCRNLLAIRRQQVALDGRRRTEESFRLNAEAGLRERTAVQAELEAANRDLASFSYTVSHDLRAPLRHIASYVGMLGQVPAVRADADALRLVARAASAADRLGHMVDELLRFAQLGRQPLRPARVELQALVAGLREELSSGLETRRIEWNVGRLPAVHGDPTLLRLALQNLLDNALKYTGRRDPARIEVSAVACAGTLTLCVRDNGVGFDMKYAGNLFGTFVRLHSEAEFPGTGIGLAHVKRIVERHGGTIRAEAAPEDGAAFFVALPL